MDGAPPSLTPTTSKIAPGGYQLGRKVFSGPGASIYEAVHPRIPGTFAVKLLERALARDARAAKAFRADAQVTASIRHPNIVQVLDINQMPDGRPFVVMELLEGSDLEQRLAGNAALPIAETVNIVEAVAAGLTAAHERGVVHRDLRPANIFLVPTVGHDAGFVKILNFGMSSLRSSAQVGGGNVHFVNEPHYMAPEQALGHVDAIDARTDQFALGAIAFRMLSGVQAFRGDDALAVLAQIAHHPPRPLSVPYPCPPGVEPTLLRALAKDRAARFSSAVEFSRAFRDAAFSYRPAGASPGPVFATGERAPEDVVGARTAGANRGYLDAGARVASMLGPDGNASRRRTRGRAFLLFALLLGVGAGSLFLAGNEIPETWRRADLWHRLRFPHGLPPQAATVPGRADLPGGAVDTGDPRSTGGTIPATGLDAAADADSAGDRPPDGHPGDR